MAHAAQGVDENLLRAKLPIPINLTKSMELTKEYFDEKLSQLNGRIDKLPTHHDLERFATKDDLLELATKSDLSSVRSDIAEVKALVQRIDRRTDEDHRAAVHDIEDLKQRVSVLEKSAAS